MRLLPLVSPSRVLPSWPPASAAVLAAGDKPVDVADFPPVFPGTLPTPPSTKRGDMPCRILGSTGEEVSLIGMGGFHIGKPDTDAKGIKFIHAGVDRGINFLDNCWDYNNGNSEVRMGKALSAGGYRKKVFLMSDNSTLINQRASTLSK